MKKGKSRNKKAETSERKQEAGSYGLRLLL